MRLFLVFALLAATAFAASKENPTPEEINEIIRRFSQNESQFAKARENYTYRQAYKIEELDRNGRPTGKMEMVADIVFTSEGKRTERVVHAPMNTLRGLIMTPEDEQDLRNVQPFVLTADEVQNYHVRYLGKETLDEIPCYAFAVKPRNMVEGRRYFAGLVWVDDESLQIVKSYGRGVGVGKRVAGQKFPKFETYREQIDGVYWFPTYTIAEDTLPFESGPLPIKMVVTYKDYKQFKAESTITFGDEVKPEPPPAPKPPR
ncbi:MAG: hypothetical protein KJZ79_06470 [Bryobacteraceae bacterium]|nr:hypothetical protein [Bryobacteraceae bacterium]